MEMGSWLWRKSPRMSARSTNWRRLDHNDWKAFWSIPRQ